MTMPCDNCDKQVWHLVMTYNAVRDNVFKLCRECFDRLVED